MATSSRSRPSTHVQRTPQTPAQRPQYQPLAAPLNNSAQRTLQSISRTHDLTGLKAHLQATAAALSNAAAEINDRFYRRNAEHARRKRHRAQQEPDGDEEAAGRGDDGLEQMEVRVADLTAKMEEKLRGAIDARAKVEAVEAALGEVNENVVASGGVVAPTQSTLGASQFRQRRRDGSSGSDEQDDEDVVAAGQENMGPSGLLKRKLGEYEMRYGNLSMRNRYSQHNDYIGFKKIVHDAKHPGADAPPLPNASTWFPNESQDPTRSTQEETRHSDTNNDNDESDVEVASERISIKCPLTLLPMRDPLTSTKCPHSFEKDAILDMISRSTTFVGGTGRRGGATQERAMKCPVCETMLTASTLVPDPILVRKIKRLQAATSHDNDDLDGSFLGTHQKDMASGAQARENAGVEIDSDEEDVPRGTGRGSVMPIIKSERVGRMGIRSSGLVGDQRTETEEEEEEDEVEEEEDEEDEEEAYVGRRPLPSSRRAIIDFEEEEEEEVYY